jgi:hypothetical protein
MTDIAKPKRAPRKKVAPIEVIVVQPEVPPSTQTEAVIVVEPIPATATADHPQDTKHKKQCDVCGQKMRKQVTTPPTEKQLASRAAFKANVNKAKELQAANPELSYRQAIKQIYNKE